jgi:outer membrane protein assembly factor BamB
MRRTFGLLVLALGTLACASEASIGPASSEADAMDGALDDDAVADVPSDDASRRADDLSGEVEADFCAREDRAGRGGGASAPAANSRCVPNCGFVECGPDGCGGTCGVCAEGQMCEADGRCGPCPPACQGRTCGPDGCGGQCGACSADALCVETVAAASCRASGPGSPLWILPGVQAIGRPALTPDGRLLLVGYDDVLRSVQPGLGVQWEVPLPSQCQGAPVVADDGTVYVADLAGGLHALRPDGTPAWHVALPGAAMGSVGLDSTGAIYLATTEETPACGRFRYRIRLHALDADGTLRWSRLLWDHLGWMPVGAFAIGPDDTIFVTRDGASLEALRPDGSVAWTFVEPQGRTFTGAPAIDGAGGPVVAADSFVEALTADGAWRFTAMVGWSVPYGLAPAIGADGSLFVPAYDLRLVDAHGTSTDLHSESGGHATPVLAADGTVYGVAAGQVMAFTAGLSLAWKVRVGDGGAVTAPQLAPDGTLYVAADGLYALDTGGSSGPCGDCPWPMHQHDPQHTNRATASP